MELGMSKLRLVSRVLELRPHSCLLEGRIPVDGMISPTEPAGGRNFLSDVAAPGVRCRGDVLSSYVLSRFSENPPFIAIPVFPSRFFRTLLHYINRNSGIREPKDLIGSGSGPPEFQMTAGVWIRGILSDEYRFRLRASRTSMAARSSPGARRS